MSARLVVDVFGRGASLYTILGVDAAASAEQLKKAYYKCALKWHPDKAGANNAEATRKFQALGFVHALLSDPERRAQYDRSGSLDDVDDAGSAAGGEAAAGAWYDYWRGFFAPVTQAAVRDFEREYRGSDEERGDVLRAYARYGGDLDGVLGDVMCSRAEDASRFVALIQAAIRSGAAQPLRAFVSRYGKGDDAAAGAGAGAGAGTAMEDAEGAGHSSSSSSSSSSSAVAPKAKGRARGAARGAGAAAGAGAGADVDDADARPTARGAAAAKKAQSAREKVAASEEKEADEMLGELRAAFHAKTKARGGAGTGASAGAGAGAAGGEPSLEELLVANREARQRGFDDLLHKYGPKPKGEGKKAALEDCDAEIECSPGKKAKRR